MTKRSFAGVLVALVIGTAASVPMAFSVLAAEEKGAEAQPVTEAGRSDASNASALKLGPDHHITHGADQIPWKDGPRSLERGAQMAVLEGDPSKRELFTMRLKLPDGYRIAPHWHPNYERVTVPSGTFRLGHGDRFDAAAAEPLDAGSYTTMPPKMRHFAIAEGETIIQLTSVGPWKINYVNPDDDPRNR